MVRIPHPTLQAIVTAAIDATAAAHGWLLAVEDVGRAHGQGATNGEPTGGAGDDALVAVVASPATGVVPDQLAGMRLPVGAGSAGYVVASGQPLALQPRAGSGDPWAEEHRLTGQVPTSILAVPCESGQHLVGVLELIDKHEGPFSFDDVEVVTLLGGIAGAALGEGMRLGEAVADPSELGRELNQMLSDDPIRYERVATVTQALLANG